MLILKLYLRFNLFKLGGDLFLFYFEVFLDFLDFLMFLILLCWEWIRINYIKFVVLVLWVGIVNSSYLLNIEEFYLLFLLNLFKLKLTILRQSLIIIQAGNFNYFLIFNSFLFLFHKIKFSYLVCLELHFSRLSFFYCLLIIF